MSKRIYDTPLAALVPESIRDDTSIRAAADALDPALGLLVRGVPDLLLWARLNPEPGFLAPVMQRLTNAAGGLKPLSLPELELLAWQLHVDFREVARTREQLAEMVRRSIPWHRIKGTPASIRAALALFGQSATIEEDGKGKYWATYQLGLPEIADLDTVRLVYRVAREMAPVRCRLWRMYSGYDRRPIVVGNGPVLGDGWLSYYSGLPVEVPGGDGDTDDSLIVSFGSRRAFQAEAYLTGDMGASFGTTTWIGMLAPYLDTFTVGRSQLSDVYPRNNPFVIGSLFSILWCERATVARSWQGEWDARRWADYTGFDRKLPRWKMRTRAVSRSQLVPGWSEVVSDTNARLGATFATVIDNPFRLGASALSNHDCERRELRLHEMTIVPISASVPPLNPGVPRAAGASRLSTAPTTLNPERVLMGGLHALVVATPPVDSPPAHAGQGQTLATRSTPPNLSDPSAVVTTYRAPLWIGAWADPGRAWNTSPKISSQ